VRLSGHKPVTTPAGLAMRLRAARLAARGGAGIGQSELAALLGVSQATISDYERGRRRPSIAVLAGLARVLGVSPAWLLEDAATDQSTGGAGGAGAAGSGQVGPWRASPGDRGQLVMSRLADILGVSVIPSLGSAGLYTRQRGVQWAMQGPETPGLDQDQEGMGLLAAESRPAYGARSLGAAGRQLVIDATLAQDVDGLIAYAGPAWGRLGPGDLLLTSRVPPGASVASPLFPDLQTDLLLYAMGETLPGKHGELLVVAAAGDDGPPPEFRLVGRIRAIIAVLA